MMMIFGLFIVIGSVMDIVMNAFSYNHVLLIIFGLSLMAIRLIGTKIKLLGGIGGNIASLLVLALAIVMITGVSSSASSMDKGAMKLIKEADKISEDEGYEDAIKFLEDKNIDLGWNVILAQRIGEIYTENEQYDEAASAYNTVLQNLPDDIEVRLLFARSLYLKKDYSRGIKEATYITKLQPDNGDAYVVIGDCYKGLNNHFREIYYYKIAVEINEKSIEKLVRLAEAYGSIHSYEKSQEYYDLAKEYATTFDEDTMIYESYLRIADSNSEEEN